MTTAAAITEKVPTPEEIDAKAKEYCELEAEIDEISKDAATKVKPLRDRMAPLGETLKTWSSLFGGAHAKKSKLLTGLVYEVMTTAGSSTSLDQAAAGLFLQVCKKAGKTRIFKKLFETLTVYRSRPEADAIARLIEEKDLAIGYTRCFITTPHALRMDVRPRKKAAEASA